MGMASWIYGHRDDGRYPQFVRHVLDEAKWHRRHGGLTDQHRAALDAAGEPHEEPDHAPSC